MNELLISMEEPKAKLRRLEELLPGATPELCAFGCYLADYLNPELVPDGFVMGCELALYDLGTGINGVTGRPIRNSLVGDAPIIFKLLRLEIPRIAKAIFPEDFAGAVTNFIDLVNSDVRKQAGA